MVPHPGDEVLSLLLGQRPLVIPEQLAGIAEDQQLHSVPPTAGTAGSGLLLRAAFPLGFGTASARAVHDSVSGVQAGPLLRRADVPNASAWPTPSVKSAASRPQTQHRRHSGQQNGGSATSGEGSPTSGEQIPQIRYSLGPFEAPGSVLVLAFCIRRRRHGRS